MKRRVMSILVAAMAATMLFGCGQATASETGEVMNSTVTGGGKTQPVEGSDEKKSDVVDEVSSTEDQQSQDETKSDAKTTVAKKTDSGATNSSASNSTGSSTDNGAVAQNSNSTPSGTGAQATGTTNQSSSAPANKDNGTAIPSPSESAPTGGTTGSVSHTPPTEIMGEQINKNEAVEEHQDSVESAHDDVYKNHFFGQGDGNKEFFDHFFKENQ